MRKRSYSRREDDSEYADSVDSQSVGEDSEEYVENLTGAEDITSQEVIRRIEFHMLTFLRFLSQGKMYKLPMIACVSSNAFFHEGAIRLGPAQKNKCFFTHSQSYMQVWRVMAFVHELLINGKTATQREAYYALVDSFNNQKELNKSIQELVALLNCPRKCLGIRAASKGTIMGCIHLNVGGQWMDCTKLGSAGMLIPGDIDEITEIASEASYIILVEKDAVFQRLCEDRIFDLAPVVVITARGMPDVATRVLLRRLQNELGLPVVGLFDWNPGGVGVMLAYTQGSIAMGLESYNYTTDVKWLGLTGEDLETFEIPESCYQPLVKWDEARIESLLRSPGIRANPVLRRELQLMKQKGIKVELQALNSFGCSFLTTYTLTKLAHGQYE